MHDRYIAKIYKHGTIFLSVIAWVYLCLLLHSEFRNKLYSERWCVTVVQRHSRSSKLVPIKSPYAISY